MKIEVNASNSYNYKSFSSSRLVEVDDVFAPKDVHSVQKALEFANQTDIDALNFLAHVIDGNVGGADVENKVRSLRIKVSAVDRFAKGLPKVVMEQVDVLKDSIKLTIAMIEEVAGE